MIIYGLDPASACGWSVFKSGEPVACGTWDLSHHRMEGAGFRWIRLRGYLNQMLEAYERPIEAVDDHVVTTFRTFSTLASNTA